MILASELLSVLCDWLEWKGGGHITNIWTEIPIWWRVGNVAALYFAGCPWTILEWCSSYNSLTVGRWLVVRGWCRCERRRVTRRGVEALLQPPPPPEVQPWLLEIPASWSHLKNSATSNSSGEWNDRWNEGRPGSLHPSIKILSFPHFGRCKKVYFWPSNKNFVLLFDILLLGFLLTVSRF